MSSDDIVQNMVPIINNDLLHTSRFLKGEVLNILPIIKGQMCEIMTMIIILISLCSMCTYITMYLKNTYDHYLSTKKDMEVD